MAQKYNKDCTGFKRTCNIAFPYHGENFFTTAAYRNDPDNDLIHHTTPTSICGRRAKDQEVAVVRSLQLNCIKQHATANSIL